jgi:hypothetical protein
MAGVNSFDPSPTVEAATPMPPSALSADLRETPF